MQTQPCPYRHLRHLPERHTYVCAIGLNFRDVGQDALACYSCPIPALLTHIDCETLDISAVMRPDASGAWNVKPQLYCRQTQLLVEEAICYQCPLRKNSFSPVIDRPGDASQQPAR